MHITLTIQSFLTRFFEFLIFAPLPLLILAAPFNYVKKWFSHQSLVRTVGKHYSDLEVVGVRELRVVFPNKKDDELEEIECILNERNLSYKI